MKPAWAFDHAVWTAASVTVRACAGAVLIEVRDVDEARRGLSHAGLIAGLRALVTGQDGLQASPRLTPWAIFFRSTSFDSEHSPVSTFQVAHPTATGAARGAGSYNDFVRRLESKNEDTPQCETTRFDGLGRRFARGLGRPGAEPGRPDRAGFPKSAQQRQAARLVALDERQHHQGRDQARPGMDERRGNSRFSKLE